MEESGRQFAVLAFLFILSTCAAQDSCNWKIAFGWTEVSCNNFTFTDPASHSLLVNKLGDLTGEVTCLQFQYAFTANDSVDLSVRGGGDENFGTKLWSLSSGIGNASIPITSGSSVVLIEGKRRGLQPGGVTITEISLTQTNACPLQPQHAVQGSSSFFDQVGGLLSFIGHVVAGVAFLALLIAVIVMCVKIHPRCCCRSTCCRSQPDALSDVIPIAGANDVVAITGTENAKPKKGKGGKVFARKKQNTYGKPPGEGSTQTFDNHGFEGSLRLPQPEPNKRKSFMQRLSIIARPAMPKPHGGGSTHSKKSFTPRPHPPQQSIPEAPESLYENQDALATQNPMNSHSLYVNMDNGQQLQRQPRQQQQNDSDGSEDSEGYMYMDMDMDL